MRIHDSVAFVTGANRDLGWPLRKNWSLPTREWSTPRSRNVGHDGRAIRPNLSFRYTQVGRRTTFARQPTVTGQIVGRCRDGHRRRRNCMARADSGRTHS